MRKVRLISIKEILEKLTFMKLKEIETELEDEDGTEVHRLYYFTSLNDIEKITVSSNLWTTINVKLSGSKETIKIFSDNINAQDESLLREYTNNVLSPSFKVKDGFIIMNSNIKRWLDNMGVIELHCDIVNIMGKYRFNNCVKIEKQAGCNVKKYNQTIDFSEEEIDKLISRADANLSNKLRMLFNEELLIY